MTVLARVIGTSAIAVLVLAGLSAASAQEPAPVPTMSVVKPPPPPVATPPLPEEGGPPGGVLSGHLYLDTDGDRQRSKGDGVAVGETVLAVWEEPLLVMHAAAAVSDASGYWEIRGLADDDYVVMWEPPLVPDPAPGQREPAWLRLASPRAFDMGFIFNDPYEPKWVVLTDSFEIKGANRVYGIDLGIPDVAALAKVTPSPTEDLPPTPGPPPPTPLLPEDGGPAGGVAGGHLFIDSNGDGTRSAADQPIVGVTILVYRINQAEDGALVGWAGSTADAEGNWQLRALPDGLYRALWQPSLRDEALLAQTIPPAEKVVLNPTQTFTSVTLVFEIKGANRVLDLDMGIPKEGPIVERAASTLPESAGDEGGGYGIQLALLAAAIAACIVAASFFTLRRRRS